jgi:hypothetical protein
MESQQCTVRLGRDARQNTITDHLSGFGCQRVKKRAFQTPEEAAEKSARLWVGAGMAGAHAGADEYWPTAPDPRIAAPPGR